MNGGETVTKMRTDEEKRTLFSEGRFQTPVFIPFAAGVYGPRCLAFLLRPRTAEFALGGQGRVSRNFEESVLGV